jgi:hypothetical protein
MPIVLTSQFFMEAAMNRKICFSWRRYGLFLFLLILMSVSGSKQSYALPLDKSLVEKNGLSWLSPLWSQGISYSDMLNRLNNSSSVYYGLEIATTYQVTDLLNLYSIYRKIEPGPGHEYWGPTQGLMNPFFDLFGWREDDVFPNFSRSLRGYVWDPLNLKVLVTGVSEYDIYGRIHLPESYEVDFWTRESSGEEGPKFGTWLVKATPVPEPSKFLLFAGGLLFLILYIRRRKYVDF